MNVGATSITSTDTVQVHRNFIAGNKVFGVNNESSGSVNGTCNWWGAKNGPGPVGPGSGDRVSTGVVYAPWLTKPRLDGPCKGGNNDKNDKDKNDKDKNDSDDKD